MTVRLYQVYPDTVNFLIAFDSQKSIFVLGLKGTVSPDIGEISCHPCRCTSKQNSNFFNVGVTCLEGFSRRKKSVVDKISCYSPCKIKEAKKGLAKKCNGKSRLHAASRVFERKFLSLFRERTSVSQVASLVSQVASLVSHLSFSRNKRS
jgi:hypothetical protein